MLNPDDVRKVAVLARLKLSDEEIEQFTGQLSGILDYVGLLEELEVESIEPMAHVADVANVFRDDQVCESLPRDAALSNAAKSDGKFFLVPQILENA